MQNLSGGVHSYLELLLDGSMPYRDVPYEKSLVPGPVPLLPGLFLTGLFLPGLFLFIRPPVGSFNVLSLIGELAICGLSS